jgi:hypothetical protein
MLPSVPQDKANHIMYGLVISIIATTVFALILDNNMEHVYAMIAASVIGASFAIVVGILKEVLDKLSNVRNQKAGLPPIHTVEVADAAYTALGGILPVLPIILVHLKYLSS